MNEPIMQLVYATENLSASLHWHRRKKQYRLQKRSSVLC